MPDRYPGRRHPPATVARALALLAEGATQAEVAIAVQVHPRTVKRWKRYGGHRKKGRPPKYSAALRREALAQLAAGRIRREIEAELHIPSGTLGVWKMRARIK